MDFPVQTDNPAEKLAEGEATEKVNRRTGNLPARAVILSAAKNPYHWYYKKIARE